MIRATGSSASTINTAWDGPQDVTYRLSAGAQVGVGLRAVGNDLDQPSIPVERRCVPLLPEPHHRKAVEGLASRGSSCSARS